MIPSSELAQQLEAILLEAADDTDASHGIHHARRVLGNAEQIVRREGVGNLKRLTAGAYLHDLINIPKNSPARAKASQLSADAAGPILERLGFDPNEVAAIRHMIVAHSFSANIEPETPDARILQDADRLEALGALGIARTFYVAGKLGSELFDGDDPFACNRSLDDARFAVDHFKTKLLGLSATMKTATGREIARERTRFMEGFLNHLAGEIGEERPSAETG